MSQTLLGMAKDLVMAQIAAHRLSPDDMHTALQQTYASLKALKMQEESQSSVAVRTPEAPSKPVNSCYVVMAPEYGEGQRVAYGA